MAVEIERKFLVINESWRKNTTSELYLQGYLCPKNSPSIRVRIAGKHSYITIKGRHTGISRLEYEYAIPITDAKIMLTEICQQPLIEKRRYTKVIAGFTWEIDEFLGENKGLIVAEIELQNESQHFPKPGWLGKEVSHLSRYYNANLARFPFQQWSENKKNP